MKLPLILRIDTISNGNILDFIVGEEGIILEWAGRLHICDSFLLHTVQYTTMPTRKINSFYLRTFISGKKNLRKLTPREKIRLNESEEIGWGYEEPLLMMPYEALGIIPYKGF
ncbi:MAG: hypothetical protein V1914_01675 [archaeon]